MPLNLLKIAALLSDVSYFYVTTSDVTLAAAVPTNLPISLFWDSAGNVLTGAFTTGSYVLEVNGVVQETGVYSVTTTGISITSSADRTIIASTPVTLNVSNITT